MVQPGDIILYKVDADDSVFQKLIGWGQRVLLMAPAGPYRHVAVAATPSSMIEAVFPKVRETGIVAEDAEIYRVANISAPEVGLVLQYARQHIGEWYNILGLLTAGLLQFHGTAVCSQFVWRAFKAAGITLYEHELLVTPDDIASSPLLTRVN